LFYKASGAFVTIDGISYRVKDSRAVGTVPYP